ncbi:hypothetical protein [Bacillus timonensis]|uniref:hypothetical protein n=1 Tax=Bacillus timonensis TaxID=1033734 RepID=UPI000302F46D|nr:hypothetical protein [Bacillus timonensis]
MHTPSLLKGNAITELYESGYFRHISSSYEEKEHESKPIVEKTTAREAKPTAKQEQPEKKAKKEKAPKIELPTDKVHFTANVKQFALTWNHFNEDNDEVIVLENVLIQQEEPIEIGLAWCSHSKTLKKLELEPGNALEFDAKIVKKNWQKAKMLKKNL